MYRWGNADAGVAGSRRGPVEATYALKPLTPIGLYRHTILYLDAAYLRRV
jgi:hypothetical protein